MNSKKRHKEEREIKMGIVGKALREGESNQCIICIYEAVTQ